MILTGDALTTLRTLPAESIQCCVTSPPYWGLRDYGVVGQLGLERTPAEYVAGMVEVFREVRRVLRKDGTCWVNLGDSYVSAPNGNKDARSSTLTTRSDGTRKRDVPETGRIGVSENKGNKSGDLRFAPHRGSVRGLKPKDMVGIPWRLAFALQDDGWWLRSDIIWSKPNPMPESVTDRPTKAHEYVFLLTRSARYFYDAAAIAEPVSANTHARVSQDVAAQIGSERAAGGGKTNGTMKAVVRGGVNPKAALSAPGSKQNESFSQAMSLAVLKRNARSVWEITTQGFVDAHFATFPPALPKKCIAAGTKLGDTVLDPFAGAGTTGLVASRMGREFVGIEINPEYAEMARRRIHDDAPLLNSAELLG